MKLKRASRQETAQPLAPAPPDSSHSWEFQFFQPTQANSEDKAESPKWQ